MKKQYIILQKPDNLDECFFVRKKVFVDEQKFDADIEIDEIDDFASHIKLMIDEKPVATARYFLEDGKYHIGRFCILKEYRKLGLGHEIIAEIEKDIKQKGHDYICLSAQFPVREFYAKAGFLQVSEVYMEEDYPHIKMEKHL